MCIGGHPSVNSRKQEQSCWLGVPVEERELGQEKAAKLSPGTGAYRDTARLLGLVIKN